MSAPAARFVLLGASNARRGFPAFVDIARSMATGDLEVLAAIGHGRSYGKWSSVPGRGLPSIKDCQLWEALREAPPAPTTALVTDIGNDLLYGSAPRVLVDWVRCCVERLCDVGATTNITELPVGNLEQLGPRRFAFFRTLFVPTCRLSIEEIADRAHEVNEGLRDIAASCGARLHLSPREWYGLDPIHIQRQKICLAWKFFLGDETFTDQSRHATLVVAIKRARSMWSRARLQLAPPAEQRLLGIDRRRAQPSLVLRSGVSVSLF